MDIVSIICKLDKSSLCVLVVHGFQKENVVEVNEFDWGFRFEMKDGSTLNTIKDSDHDS